MDEKRCDHLLAHLSEYVDGEASAAICAEIEMHLAECEDCRVVVDTLRQTVTLYQGLERPDLPEGVRKRLYKTLDLAAYFVPKDS